MRALLLSLCVLHACSMYQRLSQAMRSPFGRFMTDCTKEAVKDTPSTVLQMEYKKRFRTADNRQARLKREARGRTIDLTGVRGGVELSKKLSRGAAERKGARFHLGNAAPLEPESSSGVEEKYERKYVKHGILEEPWLGEEDQKEGEGEEEEDHQEDSSAETPRPSVASTEAGHSASSLSSLGDPKAGHSTGSLSALAEDDESQPGALDMNGVALMMRGVGNAWRLPAPQHIQLFPPPCRGFVETFMMQGVHALEVKKCGMTTQSVADWLYSAHREMKGQLPHYSRIREGTPTVMEVNMDLLRVQQPGVQP